MAIKKRIPLELHTAIADYINAHYKEDTILFAEPMTLSMDEIYDAGVERKAMYPCAPMAGKKSISLPDWLEELDAGFTETLLKLIDNTGKKDSEIYKRAGLTKQHFSKIRNNPDYKPTKPTAIALALALELDMEQTKDLIGRAGYALTNSSKFDLIIRYFIEQKKYDLMEINLALYEFDQPVLGA